MQITKVVLLFYSLVLTAGFITIGLANVEYNQLSPILLLIPVWIYFFLLMVKSIATYFFLNLGHGTNQLLRILGIYSVLIIFLMIVASLASSSNLIDAGVTIIFLPLFAACWINLFDPKALLQYRFTKLIALAKLWRSMKSRLMTGVGRSKGRSAAIAPKTSIKKTVDPESAPELSVSNPVLLDDSQPALAGIDDFKRRQFLKIVGGGGVSLFLMLFVFKGNANAAFFGSGGGPGVVALKDKNGDKIDPAEKKPTDGYTISEIDDTDLPSYYGFIHKNGSWYIAREEASGTFKYFTGSANFAANWADRETFQYDYFDEIF